MKKAVVVLATHNEHKVKEVKEILSEYHIDVLSLNDLNVSYEEPIENGKNYSENAIIKAKSAAKYTDLPIISDDSGLEIRYLNNEPGLHTARYAESLGGHDKANAYLVDLLKSKNKKASFHCHIALVNYKRKPLIFKGVCKGKIATKVSGNKGFGYDPIFIPNGYEVCFAELGEDIKNKISHRGRALAKLAKYLSKHNH